MSRALLAPLAAAWLWGCAGDLGPGGANDAPPDAGTCSVVVAFAPMSPVASPTTMIRADATVTGAIGVLDYSWSVTYGGALVSHTNALDNGSAIQFPAVDAGVYNVSLDVRGGMSVSCPTVQAPFYVMAEGANQGLLRVRVTPPVSENVPPYEKLVQVLGGAPTFPIGLLALDPGATVTATVRSGATGVESYLRLMPVASPEAAVEVFTTTAGAFTARVQVQAHDVLVVPKNPAFPPQVVSWGPGMTAIDVVAGGSLGGRVLGPSGPLGGAKVQLKAGGVPSTLAITAADGTFTLRVADPAAIFSVDVTPPDGSGLPRLHAKPSFALGPSFEVSYAPVVLRNLMGTTIVRGANPVGNAKVVVVGELAGAGTVTAGAMSASASGVVRIAATTNNGGNLPSMLAPARPLSAVVEVTASPHAVGAFDLTSGVPGQIVVPLPAPLASQLQQADGTPIADAVFDAIPAGELALAGVTATTRVRSGAGGQVSGSLAGGGTYHLRIHDPLRTRGAARILLGVPAGAVVASYALRPGMAASGKLQLQGGNPTPLGGAAIQIFCEQCEGIERSLPLAEGTTQPDGTFSVVVPDPGVN